MISLRLSRVACSVEIVRNGYGARINRTNARRAAQWQKLRQHFRYQGFIKGAQRCSGENNGDNCETDWHPDLQYLARTSPFSREASNPYASFCFRYGCICRLHDFEIGLPPRVRFRGAVVIFMFAFPVAALHFSARNPRLLGQWCPSLSRVSEGVAISGPILSIVQPCFGQTGMECGAERRRPSVNPRAALMRLTLDWVWSANAFHAEPETN